MRIIHPTKRPNHSEVHFEDEGNTIVVFSYETPIAFFTDSYGWAVTEEKFSATTSRHQNTYPGVRLAPAAFAARLPRPYLRPTRFTGTPG